MTRKQLEEMGLSKEQVDTIIKINGDDIENAKSEEKKLQNTVDTLTTQVSDLQGQISQRDTDMKDLQDKLTAAQKDATKLSEVQQSLTDLQGKYDTDKKDWEAKNAQQAYEYKVRERANGLKFSSNAAHNEFIRSAIAKNFQIEGDKLLGFDDYVTSYKESDPGAFASEHEPPKADPAPQPSIVTNTNKPVPPDAKGFGFHFYGVRAMPKE